jgi:UDP-N-acetyl-D-glucosamine dehydrogenase
MITQMQVAIVGQGYVGLTVSVGSLSAGYEVIGIDKSEKTVAALNKGISHIEGISNSLIKNGIDSGKYRASTNFSEIQSAQVVIIAVPTPLDLDGKPDISILKSVVYSITPYLAEGALVINESTSFIGTLREVIAEPIKAKNPKVEDFAVSPERVDPGNLNQ